MVVLKKTSTSTATTTFLLPISATATACASLDREGGERNPCKKESQSQSLLLQQNPSHVLQSQSKKKVRRRVHGSKSYQGRVLNMAEARKEIVTALKIHRANMKANSQKHPSSPQVPPLPHLHHYHYHHPLLPPPGHQQQQQATTDEESQREVKSRRINRIYAPNSISASYRIDFPKSISYRHYRHSSINSDNDPRKQQLLLHDLHSSTTISSSISSCASSSSSSSPTTNSNTSTTVASLEGLTSEQNEHTAVVCKTSLHPVMDDEKMAEIRLLGEQHAMEWNDNLNMATALAWWCKFVGEHDDRNSGECLKDFCRIDEHGSGHEQVPSFICHDYSNPEICYFPWLWL